MVVCYVKEIQREMYTKVIVLLNILMIVSFLLCASPVFATVFEFDSEGGVTVYAADDYLSSVRHQKISRKALFKNIKENHSKEFDDYVMKASQKYGVDASLIHAVIKAESSYDTNALSPKGAGGLMQLMPQTATQYGVTDRFSPEENIDGGTKYLSFLLNKYEGDIGLAVAAYNAGEGAVDKYGDIPPYSETKAYVQKISLFLEEQN